MSSGTEVREITYSTFRTPVLRAGWGLLPVGLAAIALYIAMFESPKTPTVVLVAVLLVLVFCIWMFLQTVSRIRAAQSYIDIEVAIWTSRFTLSDVVAAHTIDVAMGSTACVVVRVRNSVVPHYFFVNLGLVGMPSYWDGRKQIDVLLRDALAANSLEKSEQST